MALPRVSMVQFLMQKGYLKQEQLDEANKVKEQTKATDIGKVLVQLGMVGEREVLQAKAQELGYAFVDLDRVTIESSALNVVREQIVKNNNVIPVKKQDNTLYVAMTNPGNLQAIDAVSLASGCRVVPVLAVPGAIEDAIKKYYGGSGATDNASTPVAAAPASNQNFNADIRNAIATAGVAQGKNDS